MTLARALLSAALPVTLGLQPAAAQCLGDRLVGSDSAINDQFGNSIATEGPWLVTGAPAHEVEGVEGFDSGQVYIFRSTPAGWDEHARLAAPDAAATDRFGAAVAISGERLLVGAFWNDVEGEQGNNHGAAYIYRLEGDEWLLEQQLAAPDPRPEAWFGYSTALAADRALIGAPGDANGAGAAYVMERGEQGWVPDAMLTAADGKPGDRFGMFAVLDGDRAIVSAAVYDGPGGADQGAVYIFERTDGVWQQTAKLLAPDAHADDYFGSGAPLVVGNELMIPAIGAGGAKDTGAMYIFQETDGAWKAVQKLTPTHIAPGGSFGTSLVADGDRLFVGAGQADLGQAFYAGAVVEFRRGPQGWTEARTIPNPQPRTFGGFGIRMARTADGLAVGAMGNDGPPSASGVVYILPLSSADCDGDGVLTFADFLCFQNTFAAGNPAADCNGDTALDLFDFLCFVNVFNQGC